MKTSLRQIDDHATFAGLSAEAQKTVLDRLGWVQRIMAAGRGEKGALVQLAAASLRCDAGSIHRYLRYYKDRGWQGLVDGRAAAGATRALPAVFQNYVRQLHLQNQRSTTGQEVHRQIVERWSTWRRTGDPAFAIPGYDSPPAAERTGYPKGWSVDSIYRLRPEQQALSTVRQGAKAAADFLPSVLKTRCGIRFGQVVFFDDQDDDVKIVAPGTSMKSLRPQGFNCIDYLSGCFLGHHIRLRWWDTAAEQYRTLTQQEFTWFVIAHLQRYGYRSDDGTTLVFEHGTATGYNNQDLLTFSDHHSFDDALAAVSCGKIHVNRSGLFNSPAFAGMLFRPQSTGNFRFKAPLESMFNLVRNRMAALPGATGINRDMKPAEQYGQDHYIEALMKIHERLDEQHRQLLVYPLMTPQQFGTAAAAVYQAINSRTEHNLQGWEDCGFVAPQIRFTPDDRSPWMSQDELAKLPDAARSAALALSEIPGHVRNLKLSPAHVAEHHAHELTKLPDHTIPLLIPRQWARRAVVKSDRTISISDQLLGPEPFQYVCRFETRDGAHVLATGTELLCYLNPFNPDRLAICRPDGSFIGTLTRQTRASFLDQAAIVSQLEERAKLKADLDSAVRPHLAGLIGERQAMQRHNDRLASGKPVTPEEIHQARHESGLKAASTRRLNDWADEMPEDMPADLLQDPCSDDAPHIPESQIAAWLED